jgi:hypothetical protein
VAAPCSVTAGDRAADGADVADGAFDRADRCDRPIRRLLHVGDLRGDVVGRLRGLAGQRLDFARHDGEAATCVPGAGGLDGGIERQQVGLLGDFGDQPDHVADPLGGAAQLLHRGVAALGIADRLLGDGIRFRHPAIDLHHRGGQLVGGRGDVAHIAGCLGRRRWRLRAAGGALGRSASCTEDSSI